MGRFTANKLKEVREERGYSQSEAAKYMHISDRNFRIVISKNSFKFSKCADGFGI